MKFRALTYPGLKIPCKGLRRLCLLFSFDLQEETNEVTNRKWQGLPWWSDIEWLRVLIYSADASSSLSRDSSKVPENTHLYWTVWIHLKEHGIHCKSPFQLWTKKDAACSLCLCGWILVPKDTSCKLILPFRSYFCPLYDTAWLKLWKLLFQCELATCLLSKENSGIP